METKYAYHVELTDYQYRALGWFVDRGYFPTEVFDDLEYLENARQ